MISRTEFVNRYAVGTGMSDEGVELGFLKHGTHYLLAMPCYCGKEFCEGWRVVRPEEAPDVALDLANAFSKMAIGKGDTYHNEY